MVRIEKQPARERKRERGRETQAGIENCKNTLDFVFIVTRLTIIRARTSAKLPATLLYTRGVCVIFACNIYIYPIFICVLIRAFFQRKCQRYGETARRDTEDIRVPR